jgi:hypothetical protein
LYNILRAPSAAAAFAAFDGLGSSSSRGGRQRHNQNTVGSFFFFFFFFNTHRHFECVSVCVWFGLYFTVSGFIEKKRIPERAEKIKIKKLNKCATGVCHGVFCSFFLSLSMAQRLEIPPHVGKWNDT